MFEDFYYPLPLLPYYGGFLIIEQLPDIPPLFTVEPDFLFRSKLERFELDLSS